MLIDYLEKRIEALERNNKMLRDNELVLTTYIYVLDTCNVHVLLLYLPKLPSSTTSNLEKGEVSIMRDVVPLSTIL